MRALSLFRDIWRHRHGLPNRPRFLTYIVTFKCNARCLMCDCWQKPSPDELTVDEIARVFAQLPRMDAVRLTGGEPFVRPDLPEIARLAEQTLRPRFLHLTTNGFLTSRIVTYCEQRARTVPLRVLVSLDGTRDKHNAVRGRETAWDTAFATVQALARRQHEWHLRLAVNQTIVDGEGVREYQKLRDLLQPLGVPVNVVIAYAASATYSVADEVESAPTASGQFEAFGQLHEAETLALLAELEHEVTNLPLPERLAKQYYLRGLRHRLLAGQGLPRPSCVALNSHLRLYPNGDVPVCQFNSRRVGNLRRQPFAEIWQAAPIQREREWVRRCPGCWAECEVLPNALYSGDAFLELLRPRRAQPEPSRLPGTRTIAPAGDCATWPGVFSPAAANRAERRGRQTEG